MPHESPERWRHCESYLFGCDLYNHGYWWEAHESWEGLWQTCDKAGTQGRFLQGLIQIAAAHLKCRLGHLNGEGRLLGSGVSRLRAVDKEIGGGIFMGLEVARFIDHVNSYYAMLSARRADRGGTAPCASHDAAAYPYIRLHFVVSPRG